MKRPDLKLWVEKFAIEEILVEKYGLNLGVEKSGVEMSCNPIASLGLGMYLTMLVLVPVAKNVYLAVDQLPVTRQAKSWISGQKSFFPSAGTSSQSCAGICDTSFIYSSENES